MLQQTYLLMIPETVEEVNKKIKLSHHKNNKHKNENISEEHLSLF